jgi:tetratricopeptide (TPR) repeat protein
MEILAFLNRLSQPSGQTRLHQILTAHFNEEELRTLCLDLDIDYDDLPSEGKVSKARELIAYLDRRGRIPELIEVGRKQRPDLVWGSVSKSISKALLTSRQDVRLHGRSWTFPLGSLTTQGTVRYLPKLLQQEALAVVQAIRDEGDRARVLVGLAPYLPEAERAEAWQQALAAVRAIRNEDDRVKALAALAPHLPDLLLREALTLARQIGSGEARAEALVALVPHLPETLRVEVLREVLIAAQAITNGSWQTKALLTLVPYLPEPLLEEALVSLQALPGSSYQPDYLNNLGATLRGRYARTGNLTDLERAVGYYQRALALSLTQAARFVWETTRQVVEFGKELVVQGRYADTLRIAPLLSTTLDSARQETIAKHAIGVLSEEHVLVREPVPTYQIFIPYNSEALQAAALVADVLSVLASVAAVRMDGSPPAEYDRALQALELARQVDKATDGTFELARWVREASCYEFVELEEADRWPPRLAHLVHLGARYERDENRPAAINTYRQARALLDPNKGDEELTRYTELGFRLGLCLKQDGRWSEALKQQEENIAGYKKLGNPYGKASAYLEMGHIYQMMNIYDLALLYYGEAYYLYQKASEEAGDEAVRWSAQRGMADAKESLGNLEFQLKLFPRSFSDLEDAEKLYLTLGMPGKAAIMRQTLASAQEPAGGPHD